MKQTLDNKTDIINKIGYGAYLISQYGNAGSDLVVFPKILTAETIDVFLDKIEIIFKKEGTNSLGFEISFQHVQKMDILGALLIFKFFEYTIVNKCFILPTVNFTEFVQRKITEYGFLDLINAYILNTDRESSIENMDIKITNKFFIAPQPLIRKNNFTNNYIKEKVLPALQRYYSDNFKTISMISTCFSEISLNFWEHAIEDTQSIMLANGNKETVEIACADTGNGIISTLKKNKKYEYLDDLTIFSSCVERDVTSKEKTNHMGFGLWLINQLITEIKGKLLIYSEGYKFSNEKGLISIKKTNYWKGTIIYLSLPLKTAKTLNDIEAFKNYIASQKNKILIDYV